MYYISSSLERIEHVMRDLYVAEDLGVSLDNEGSREYAKVSYPIRYGNYARIMDTDYIYQFNLSGEIKFIQGHTSAWPGNEWLKRTAANDWVYYSTEGYSSVHSLTGEYYLPCFSYSKNSISAINPFETATVKKALNSLENLFVKIGRLCEDSAPREIRPFFRLVSRNDKEKLRSRSDELHEITGAPLTVLPPDTRHVDYDVIPIIIADGCLYNCEFCIVKTKQNFLVRSRDNITRQIEHLKNFYGQDLVNYNSIFLGQHDALQAGADIIEFASVTAYEMFQFKNSIMKGANLFFFGSIDSLLSSSEILYESLNKSPFFTYINIGLESADQESLDILKKPVTADLVKDAFRRIADINRRFERIEATANFVIGSMLPENHRSSIIDLAGNSSNRYSPKGTVYLSPLDNGEAVREIRKNIYRIKNHSRFPVYLYLMQRL